MSKTAAVEVALAMASTDGKQTIARIPAGAPDGSGGQFGPIARRESDEELVVVDVAALNARIAELEQELADVTKDRDELSYQFIDASDILADLGYRWTGDDDDYDEDSGDAHYEC